MQKFSGTAGHGDVVAVRGAAWRLVERRPFERCALVTLQGLDGGNPGETLRVLEPFDRLVIPRRAARLRSTGRWATARRVADAIAASHPWGGCRTAATANIQLLPWQLEPALAVLGGATRLLLADGVGLGKTVQAGLILAELSARGLIERALVLTPAGLRAQWADELSARFGLRGSVLDQSALAREAAHLPPGGSPWASAPIVISSIDLAKRPDTLAALGRVPFDLLIVDEAHHLTPDSERGALIARLAQRTPWVVLISATPHSGDERAFRFLSALGGSSSDRLTIFRRSAPRGERTRRTRLIRLTPAPDETALIEGVHRYAQAIWRAHGASNSAARLVAIVLARRAASSADAVLVSLIRRRALLEPHADESVHEQAPLPWEEPDARDAVEPDDLLSAPGLLNAGDEQHQLDELIALAERARAPATKARWIQRLLSRTRESLIVFSEFRDTIEALRARFEPMTRVTVLHGGLSPSMRRAATAAFVSGERRLLLATDAGGEGLNLHARCRAVIDVELPWNPLRLEQRIGRVDRLGQQRRVHALHLVHAGSVEDTVLAHLHRRMARVDAASTNARDNDLEARVADAVLGGSTATLAIPEWRSDSLPAALDEAQRLEHLRRLQGNTTPGVATDVPVSLPRRRDGPVRTAHCTFAVTISERSGRAISDVIVPLSIALSPTLPSERAGRIRSLHGIADHAVSQPLVQAFVRETLRTEQTARDAFIDAVRARVQALREALRREGGYAFQPALFDGRATRAATDRAAVLEIHRAHLERVESALGTPGDLVAGTPRLVGISVLS